MFKRFEYNPGVIQKLFRRDFEGGYIQRSTSNIQIFLVTIAKKTNF